MSIVAAKDGFLSGCGTYDWNGPTARECAEAQRKFDSLVGESKNGKNFEAFDYGLAKLSILPVEKYNPNPCRNVTALLALAENDTEKMAKLMPFAFKRIERIMRHHAGSGLNTFDALFEHYNRQDALIEPLIERSLALAVRSGGSVQASILDTMDKQIKLPAECIVGKNFVRTAMPGVNTGGMEARSAVWFTVTPPEQKDTPKNSIVVRCLSLLGSAFTRAAASRPLVTALIGDFATTEPARLDNLFSAYGLSAHSFDNATARMRILIKASQADLTPETIAAKINATLVGRAAQTQTGTPQAARPHEAIAPVPVAA